MKVLIIVDGQIDFLTGALPNPDAVDALPVIQSMLEYARANGFTILYTKDTHDPKTYATSQEGKNLPIPHCLKDTEGWMIHGSISPRIGEKVILKPAFGFNDWWRVWELHNKDVEEIWIAGFVSEICVRFLSRFSTTHAQELHRRDISRRCM